MLRGRPREDRVGEGSFQERFGLRKIETVALESELGRGTVDAAATTAACPRGVCKVLVFPRGTYSACKAEVGERATCDISTALCILLFISG
jgi:hypothetical protein